MTGRVIKPPDCRAVPVDHRSEQRSRRRVVGLLLGAVALSFLAKAADRRVMPACTLAAQVAALVIERQAPITTTAVIAGLWPLAAAS